jgi:hypothetical protein
MAGIPTGTVTFLFTDIEGSTKLAREHPETWEVTRERHREGGNPNERGISRLSGNEPGAAPDVGGARGTSVDLSSISGIIA